MNKHNPVMKPLWPRLRSFFRSIAGRSHLEQAMDEEIRFHLEARAADLAQQGLSPVEAARQARLEFGTLNTHKSDMRRSLGLRWWDDLLADLRYAARILRKSPAFTFIAAGSLARAIGANTTIFSVANELLYERLGVPHPEQRRSGGAIYIIRTTLKPEALTPSLRAAVQKIDPDLPLKDIRTQEQQIDATIQQERTFASLTAGFGILALALACVGIYGIMTYTIAQRTNEVGIRLALGAQRARVRSMVIRESAWLTFLGIATGLAAALAFGRLVKSMLYGLSPTDPISLAGAALLLLARSPNRQLDPSRPSLSHRTDGVPPSRLTSQMPLVLRFSSSAVRRRSRPRSGPCNNSERTSYILSPARMSSTYSSFQLSRRAL